jgi:urease alpha subunit
VKRWLAELARLPVWALVLLAGTATASSIGGALYVAGQIPGTATNDTATAGNVGEVMRLTRARSASIQVTSNTACNVGAATCPATGGTQSITLTPGDWSCQAMMTIDMAATTCVQAINLAVSATSNTLPSTDVISVPTSGEAMYRDMSSSNMFCNDEFTKTIPPYQVTVASGATKTLYLVAQTTHTVSTLNVYGSLECRRMR